MSCLTGLDFFATLPAAEEYATYATMAKRGVRWNYLCHFMSFSYTHTHTYRTERTGSFGVLTSVCFIASGKYADCILSHTGDAKLPAPSGCNDEAEEKLYSVS